MFVSTSTAPTRGPIVVPKAQITFMIINHLGLNSAGMRSDTMTSASAVEAPPPAPCRALPTTNTTAFGATAQITHPTMASAAEAPSKDFRPHMNDTETKRG